MRKSGKVWGETSLIHANGALEFHRIEARTGGRCSKHLHEYKWNGFYVETGLLVIKVWQKDYDLVDVTHLRAGDFMQVKPGLYHSFEALKDTVAFELYWAEFNHDDIVRETVGGVANVTPIETDIDFEAKIDFEAPMLDAFGGDFDIGRPGKVVNLPLCEHAVEILEREGFHEEAEAVARVTRKAWPPE